MLHGQLSTAKAKDKTEVIPLRDMKNRYIDYLALGHLHDYQSGKLDTRGTWCYSGCLQGRGFDECGEKGYVLLEVEDREFVSCTDSEYRDELMREMRKSEGFEDRFGYRFPARTNKKRKGR